MKAYVLNAVGRLDFMEAAKPELKPGQALVNVRAAGICGSDIPRIFVNGTYHFPTIPGHEFAGIVTEVYDKESECWLGKRVGVFPLIPCRNCVACRNKQYEMCTSYDYLGSRCDGGFAEYAAVPVRNMIELPDEISYEAAAMLEPAAVGMHALERADIGKVKKAAVFGPGTIGLLTAQWLRIKGVEEIFLVGSREEQRRLAGELGFTIFLNGKEEDAVLRILEQTSGEGVDLALDCVGDKSVVTDCVRVVKRGGEVLLIGNPHGDLQMEKNVYWQILRKQLKLSGTWNSSFIPEDPEDDWTRTIAAIQDGTLLPEKQITHKLKFDELHKGLEIMREKSEFYNKIMIVR